MPHMKRYLLFLGHTFDDLGGWNDFSGDFDSIGEARAVAAKLCKNERGEVFLDWYQVVDSVEKMIIEQGNL